MCVSLEAIFLSVFRAVEPEPAGRQRIACRADIELRGKPARGTRKSAQLHEKLDRLSSDVLTRLNHLGSGHARAVRADPACGCATCPSAPDGHGYEAHSEDGVLIENRHGTRLTGRGAARSAVRRTYRALPHRALQISFSPPFRRVPSSRPLLARESPDMLCGRPLAPPAGLIENIVYGQAGRATTSNSTCICRQHRPSRTGTAGFRWSSTSTAAAGRGPARKRRANNTPA